MGQFDDLDDLDVFDEPPEATRPLAKFPVKRVCIPKKTTKQVIIFPAIILKST